MCKSKAIVHELYNDIAQTDGSDMNEIKEVLLKVYQKLDNVKDEVPLINRLVNFIYFKALNEHLSFTPSQDKLIGQSAQIGGKAGLNGVYRSDHGDKSQFD